MQLAVPPGPFNPEDPVVYRGTAASGGGVWSLWQALVGNLPKVREGG